MLQMNKASVVPTLNTCLEINAKCETRIKSSRYYPLFQKCCTKIQHSSQTVVSLVISSINIVLHLGCSSLSWFRVCLRLCHEFFILVKISWIFHMWTYVRKCFVWEVQNMCAVRIFSGTKVCTRKGCNHKSWLLSHSTNLMSLTHVSLFTASLVVVYINIEEQKKMPKAPVTTFCTSNVLPRADSRVNQQKF